MKRAIPIGVILLFAGFSASANMLQELYQQAREYDAQFRGARAEYQAALQAKPQLRATMLPQLSATGTAQRARDKITQSVIPQQIGSSTSSSFSASLRLSQPLFDWAGFARLRQMDEQVARAEAGLASAEQDLILRTVGAYFDWLAAEDNLRFARAEKQAISQQLRQAQSRYEVGLSAITDVHEAQARFDASRAQEIAAASRLRSARESLQLITGQRPENAVPLQSPLKTEPPSPASPDEWAERALAHNLNLKQVELSSRLAREQVREAQAAYLPQLSLFAEQTYTDRSDTPQGLESEGSSIGLQLQVPLFAGGGNHARAKEKRFVYEQAQAELLLRQREAVQLTRDAYDGVVTGEVQVAALSQAVKSAGVALQAIEAGFRVGSRTSVDVLDAQRLLYGAQSDLARARYDYLLSVLRLKQAVGALAEPDLAALDQLLVQKP